MLSWFGNKSKQNSAYRYKTQMKNPSQEGFFCLLVLSVALSFTNDEASDWQGLLFILIYAILYLWVWGNTYIIRNNSVPQKAPQGAFCFRVSSKALASLLCASLKSGFLLSNLACSSCSWFSEIHWDNGIVSCLDVSKLNSNCFIR